jgi:DNA invertase Pin-like site-specific DNA recombinase
MRVSTGRQAEHDLSIPDQRSQLQSWCRGNGHHVVAEYVEAGASAGDDRRPSFQQMIERACDGEHAFDLIVVHSYSRFFREAFEQEFYLRKLAKHAVRVVSIKPTQIREHTETTAKHLARQLAEAALLDLDTARRRVVQHGIDPLVERRQR